MWFVIGVIAVSSLMLIVRLFAVLNVGGKTGLSYLLMVCIDETLITFYLFINSE